MKRLLQKIALLSLLCLSTPSKSFKIDRVILTSNNNPTYLQFWPLVARAWRDRIGIKPTLFLVSDESIEIDETIGDVIRVHTIEGVSTANHAQILRLLAPIYFEEEICLISDIDMLPLNRDYFIKSVEKIPDDRFVVYRDAAYGDSKRFPMCYNAGKGKLFKSIFNISSIDEIPQKIKGWINWWISQGGTAWDTDEVVLFTHVRGWEQFAHQCIFLHHTSMVEQRIDRADWRYDKEKLKNNYYIDAHMVRPLDTYRKEIEELAHDLGLII